MMPAPTNILLLSNVNLEPLQDRVSPEGASPVSLSYDGFNTLGRRISEGFESIQGSYDYVWIHADLNFPGLVSQDFHTCDASDFRNSAIGVVDQWIERLAVYSDTRFLFSTFYFHSLWNHGQTFAAHQQMLNHELNEWLTRRVSGVENIELFPYDRLVKQMGELSVYDNRLWILGRIPYPYPFLNKLHHEICDLVPTLRVAPRKVLALDLDNTLWGGTLDEQETSPLVLDVEGPGLAYLNFQRAILGLRQKGVLLAIVSKNEVKDVETIISNHPFMVLRKDDFAEILANWDAKSLNLKELSDRLGLTPDSFVMIDDNPRERAEIRQNLPEVVTPEFPEDPADLERWFYEEVVAKYFNVRALTEADTQRTERYRTRKKRQEAANQYASIENFLRSLDIRFHIAEATPEERARVYQLLQRTNQFNLNKDPELLGQSLESRPDHKTWVLHYRDVFGVEGLVGAIVVKHGVPPTIESFAVSCRVLGKRVEHALLLRAIENIETFEADLCFQNTGNNQQMVAFLESLRNLTSTDLTKIGPVAELIETLKKSIQCITHETS